MPPGGAPYEGANAAASAATVPPSGFTPACGTGGEKVAASL
jgi:hypothetical protein